MDVSNPVMTSDRTSFLQMNGEVLLQKRQDFKILEEMTKQGGRVQAPILPGRAKMEVKTIVLDEYSRSAALPVEKGAVQIDKCKTKENFKLSKVPHRTFLPAKRDRDMARYILARNPGACPIMSEKVYSTGTKAGFKKRIETWMQQKVVSIKQVCNEEGLNPMQILQQRLPLKGTLKNWNGEYLELLKDVKITKNSSAGPPYFEPKMQVWDDVVADIGKFLEAAEGDISEYLNERPWILACECKNKTDRYDAEKLKEKTRPYFSMNAPLQIFLSFLAQNFCEKLQTFDQSKDCWNAYGFSIANGGGEKIRKWVSTLKEGERKVAVYGDDVMLIWKKEGLIYNVMPDFSQQDASIDEHTVDYTIDYIVQMYRKDHGKNPFWEMVAKLWKIVAVDSKFWIDGPQMYSKRKASLRTGVVGTTLFDTVKSIVSYEVLIHKRVDLFDAKTVQSEFKKMGLTIKEGTWKPDLVYMGKELGHTLFDSKWLGCLFQYHQGEERKEPVPHIPEEDLMMLLGNPRMDTKMTRTGKQRYMFDMARGYMITGAYQHPNLWNSLSDIINDTPNDIVVMRVQAGEGNGERPESVLIPEDFVWPSSDGVPNPDYCLNVFLSEGNKLKSAEWLYIFPHLKNVLRERKEVLIKARTNDDPTKWSNKMGELEEETQRKLNPNFPPEMNELTALTGVYKHKSHVTYVKMETDAEKFKRMETILDSNVEEFTLDWVKVVFSSYGTQFVLKTLDELGWHLHASRVYRRKPPSNPISTKDLKDVAYYLKKMEIPTKPEPEKKKKRVTLEEGCKDVLKKAANYLGPPSQDVVSRVSSAFVTIGEPLAHENKVLSQAPPRVEHRVFTKTGTFSRSRSDCSGKEARKKIYEDLLKEMEEVELRRVKEKEDGEEEEQEPENETNYDNSDNESTGTNGTNGPEDWPEPEDQNEK